MKILVTGGTGFIGSHLIPRLVEKGHEVTSLHRYVTGRYVLGENVESVFADLQDSQGIRDVIGKVDPEVIIHLAAISPVAYSYDHPQEVTKTNYLGLINLVEACRELGSVDHFISAGTSEEYGNQENIPIREDAKLYPKSPYAISKAASTKYLEYMRDAYDFPMTVCRPFNTYGRKKNRHFVVERILTQMLENKAFISLGDPDPVRDLMYREDHVNAYLAVLNKPDWSIGETYNFCTGIGYSIKELVDLCVKITKWEGGVQWNTIPKRPLDIDTLIGCANKARIQLNWKPKYDLTLGLIESVEYWKKVLNT